MSVLDPKVMAVLTLAFLPTMWYRITPCATLCITGSTISTISYYLAQAHLCVLNLRVI